MKTFKQFLTEDPLHDLQMELALMQEFELTQEDAAEVVLWLNGDQEAADLDCWDDIWSRWEDDLEDLFPNDSRGFPGHVKNKVEALLKHRYGIDV